MKILGIDPGLKRTGFAVIACDPASPNSAPRLVDAGVFSLKPDWPVSARLNELYRDLVALIDEHRPQGGAVEKLYAHYEHPTTAIAMGHARGVVLLALQQAGIELIELPSTEVKKSITGNGHASKEQVGDAVRAILGLPVRPEPNDVSDAMAIAITASRRA